MLEKARIAVMVSGGGTNLQALIDAQKSGIIKSGNIELVIASKEGVYALERAANAGIHSVVCKTEEEILEELKKDCVFFRTPCRSPVQN